MGDSFPIPGWGVLPSIRTSIQGIQGARQAALSPLCQDGVNSIFKFIEALGKENTKTETFKLNRYFYLNLGFLGTYVNKMVKEEI